MRDERLTLKTLAKRMAANEDVASERHVEFVHLVARVNEVEKRTDNHAHEFREGFDRVGSQITGLQKSMEKIGNEFKTEIKSIGEEFTKKMDAVVVAVNGLKVTEGRVDGMLSVLKPIGMVIFAAAVGYYVGGK